MTTLKHDIELPEEIPELLIEKHVNYLLSYGTKKDDYNYHQTEHIKMSGIYWGLTALDLMGALERANKEDMLEFIGRCQNESGGISASLQHDPHLLYTLSAVQILCMYNALDVIDIDKVVNYVRDRQQADGSFTGDQWGEVDVRFSFCAIATLSLLVNILEHIPESESHAGLIYCCVGLLSITGHLHLIDADRLGWWLCERQLPSGGLNGRPEKLPDVCYSWWVLSALTILGRLQWLDKEAITNYILSCQDVETGGFSDRPGDMVDPFHTLFGLAALSLLDEEFPLKPINPTYCMPEYIIDRLGLNPSRLDV
ncbi:hypothetical protein DMN91_009758 [Ooceraea biroi]|uniref:Geranylgeranyl transferase type-2 subunit beta n=1 Tax=Ooceraea biroi TaxID=2015173 RepID=A0A3L8DBN4_OOCBI|nr:hypothetical protein DMN91_009758 [Ooceraea biroi]